MEGASPFLKAFGLLLCGGYLLKSALISNDKSKLDITNFYFYQILPEMYAHLKAVDYSYKSLNDFDLESI